MSLAQDVRQSQRTLDQELGQRTAVEKQKLQLRSEIEARKELIEVHAQVVSLLNTIGEDRQNLAQQQIEGIVTKGLQTIFESNLTFHAVSSYKANAAHLEFVVRSHRLDGTTMDTPILDAMGGGLASIVGFLLRVVQIMLSPQSVSRTLILDETFAAVSAEYEVRLSDFIRELIDKTDLQVILVTHSTAFSDNADRVYHFSLKNGKTQIQDQATA